MTRRDQIKAILRHVGLDRVISRVRYVGRLAINHEFRRVEAKNRQEYREWRTHRDLLNTPLGPAQGSRPRALIVGKGTINGAKVEVALLKGLELGGFTPVVLTDKRFAKYYRLAGVREFVHWEQFTEEPPVVEATALGESTRAVGDLLPFEHRGARVGKFALSSTFRSLRTGRLDFSLAETRRTLANHLAEGMARAAASHRILDRVRPDLVVFMGNRYSGHAELMDVAIDRGTDVLTWFDAHRSSALILKRYHKGNRDQHHASLSDGTWNALLQTSWSESDRRALHDEIAESYASGDWYSRGGTQVNKKIIGVAELRERLRLDPAKKTAVVFPHVVWDATLFWGTDLFNNYEDWLVETVRVAYANPSLNWVIKVHPVHVAKGAMERYTGEPREVVAIRERVGPCPPHVSIIGADTDLNTFSLFGVMDYCLTVRGTIGVECASRGIRVLTAGTGRYDHRGFTLDSDTPAEYLERLSRLHTIPAMTPAERDLAERYAYAAFLMRPLPLTSFVIEHDRDVEATMHVRVAARSVDELRNAPDLRALAAWAADATQEDFLWQPSRPRALERPA